MASDREVLREVWEGKLPVCFKLDPDEVADLQQPDPFYLMVPRLSYFPLGKSPVFWGFFDRYYHSSTVQWPTKCVNTSKNTFPPINKTRKCGWSTMDNPWSGIFLLECCTTCWWTLTLKPYPGWLQCTLINFQKPKYTGLVTSKSVIGQKKALFLTNHNANL